MRLRLLPWEYGLRNLYRRPLRSALTLVGLSLAILLVLGIAGFVGGLEAMLTRTGRADVVLVFGAGSADSLERSEVGRSVPSLLAAVLPDIRRTGDVPHVSPEAYLGTLLQVGSQDAPKVLGLVRGVTPAAFLVHPQVYLAEGSLPRPGEVMVGRLAAAKLGVSDDLLRPGGTVLFDGQPMRISGRFAAVGTAMEAEVWCPLEDLLIRTKRTTLSCAAVRLAAGGTLGDVQAFCKERLDLELEAVRESDYYGDLARAYRPIQYLAGLMAAMIAAAGLFGGMNTLYAAVAGRTREFATLQALGFGRRAVVASLVQESLLTAAAAALPAAAVAVLALDGLAVRFTMGAFTLRIDETALGLGLATAAALGLLGALPPAWKALRMPITDALKS
jgi:ABC-type lipoprotein release transport system permease subunit